MSSRELMMSQLMRDNPIYGGEKIATDEQLIKQMDTMIGQYGDRVTAQMVWDTANALAKFEDTGDARYKQGPKLPENYNPSQGPKLDALNKFLDEGGELTQAPEDHPYYTGGGAPQAGGQAPPRQQAPQQRVYASDYVPPYGQQGGYFPEQQQYSMGNYGQPQEPGMNTQMNMAEAMRAPEPAPAPAPAPTQAPQTEPFSKEQLLAASLAKYPVAGTQPQPGGKTLLGSGGGRGGNTLLSIGV